MMYGSDGMHTPTLWESVDASNPEVLDGLTLFVASGPAIPAYQEFNDRLAEVSEGNFVFGAQSYDCAVILALAARAAGSTDGTPSSPPSARSPVVAPSARPTASARASSTPARTSPTLARSAASSSMPVGIPRSRPTR